MIRRACYSAGSTHFIIACTAAATHLRLGRGKPHGCAGGWLQDHTEQRQAHAGAGSHEAVHGGKIVRAAAESSIGSGAGSHARNTTKKMKNTMSTPKILSMSQRLEDTDCKALTSSECAASTLSSAAIESAACNAPPRTGIGDIGVNTYDLLALLVDKEGKLLEHVGELGDGALDALHGAGAVVDVLRLQPVIAQAVATQTHIARDQRLRLLGALRHLAGHGVLLLQDGRPCCARHVRGLAGRKQPG